MKQPPYTTRTGVQIGVLYQAPKKYDHTPEMNSIQDALIGRGKRLRMSSFTKDVHGYMYLAIAILSLLLLGNCAGA